MARYEERLTAYQSVDFDDLISLPLKLLRDHPEVRERWQQKMGHVLVDEYQDTNATQYDLLKLLVGERARFTAVGDDDQSIYGWRGATLDNLQKAAAGFPRAQDHQAGAKLPLHQRHPARGQQRDRPQPQAVPQNAVERSGRRRAGARGRRRQRRPRGRSRRGPHPEPASGRVASYKEWRHFAILYRANHMARPFEQALRRAQIPYKVSGGQSFFDKAEIRDLCAWLRVLVNNNDDPAFMRAATTPKRGIGHTTLQQLGNFATQYKLSLFEALFSHSLPAALPARAVATLHEFGRAVNDLEYRARHTVGHEDATSFSTSGSRTSPTSNTSTTPKTTKRSPPRAGPT